jgi:two-component system chemotaxis sensor kinase CheA
MSELAFDPSLVKEFLGEVEETLSNFGGDLLLMEKNPKDPDLINRVFRSAHGIKGMSAMFGFNKVSELTHQMENVFDRVRQGKLAIDSHIMDILFSSLDMTKALVEEIRTQEDRGIDTKKNIEALKVILEKVAPPVKAKGEIDITALNPDIANLITPYHKEVISEAIQKNEKIYEVQLNLIDAVISADVNPIAFFKIIDLAGALIVSTSIPFGVPDLESFNPERHYFKLFFLISSTTEDKKIRDVFTSFVKDVYVKELPVIKPPAPPPLGEILLSEGKITEDDLEEALSKQKPKTIGEILIEEGKVKEEDIKDALSKQKKEEKPAEAKETKAAIGKTLRVDQDKIDLFMNLIGEQTIITTTISKMGKRLKGMRDTRLAREIDEIFNASIAGERIIDEMQKTILKIRMVPLKTIFQNYPRIIRDVCSKTGKDIDFQMLGETVELDKNVVDKLNDPLVHMVRNSADHGIEMPAERERAGKNRKGKIVLHARVEEKFVIIEVEDDGQGINIKRVKDKAVEKGIISQDDADRMSRDDAIQLIFAPGFSTAKEVTDISGRGVGMDIVITMLKELGGKIDVDTEEGKGSKMTMTIPINIGILEKMLMRALIVSSGNHQFAIPVEGVIETLNVHDADIEKMKRRSAMYLRGEVLGIVPLNEIIRLNGSTSPQSSPLRGEEANKSPLPSGERVRVRVEASGDLPIVVITDGKRKIALSVDGLLGQQSIVIKPLQGFLAGIREIKGATILGDGRVILILNTEELIKRAAMEEVKSDGY